jgi:hypothetical protein
VDHLATIRPVARRVAAGAFLVVFACYSSPAPAQEKPSRYYAGVGIIAANHRNRYDGVSYKDRPVGIRAYAGAQLRERIAIEIGLDSSPNIDSGEIAGSGFTRLSVSSQYRAMKVKGMFSLDLSEVLPRRNALTVFGTAGLYQSAEERLVSVLTANTQTAANERDRGVTIGGGVLFKIANVNLRADFESLDTSRGSRDEFGISAEFRFGR